MRVLRILPVLAIAMIVVACSRERGLRCEPNERYRTSASIPPLQVPEGLTVPDESEALRIPEPPQEGATERQPGGPCLESPPGFFDEADDEADDEG